MWKIALPYVNLFLRRDDSQQLSQLSVINLITELNFFCAFSQLLQFQFYMGRGSSEDSESLIILSFSFIRNKFKWERTFFVHYIEYTPKECLSLFEKEL